MHSQCFARTGRLVCFFFVIVIAVISYGKLNFHKTLPWLFQVKIVIEEAERQRLQRNKLEMEEDAVNDTAKRFVFLKKNMNNLHFQDYKRQET